jgi:hypothetical protein
MPKRPKLDGTAFMDAADSGEVSDPDEQIICTTYIDVEVPPAAPTAVSSGSRRSRTAKRPSCTFKRSSEVLRFSAVIPLEDLIDLLAEKLQCEPNSIKRPNLMWKFETPANSTPKPFGTKDGMAALQGELRRTAGKKAVVLLTGPVKKKRVDEDEGVKSDDDYSEAADAQKVRCTVNSLII